MNPMVLENGPLYAASYYSGLREIIVEELKTVVGKIHVEQTLIGRRYDYVIFRYTGNPSAFAELRSIENLFVLASTFDGIAVNKERGLDRLRSIFADSEYDACISLVTRFRGFEINPASYITSMQIQGKHHFTNRDVQRQLQTALKTKLLPSDGGNSLNIRCQIINDKGFVGVQLSQHAIKTRSYKIQTRPGSLDPTVGYALAVLAKPQPGDTFLDAMCGAGTVAIEAAFSTKLLSVLCGDCDMGAVLMTRNNANMANVSVETCCWDAGALPLTSGSVDCAASNLPFGKDIPFRHPAPLMRRILKETARVLRPGGRIVLLTAHTKILSGMLQHSRTFTQTKKISMKLYGINVNILVLVRSQLNSREPRRKRKKTGRR